MEDQNEDSMIHIGPCPTCGALAQAISGEVITYRHIETNHKQKVEILERELLMERNVSARLAEREVANAIRAEDAERKLDKFSELKGEGT